MLPEAGTVTAEPMADSDCWYTYMVRCSDLTLYTGIAKDPEKRLQEHNTGKNGARYTRARRPVQLVFLEKFTSRSAAAKREHQLKQMSRTAKKQLMLDYLSS
jgi:putative endonuclease